MTDAEKKLAARRAEGEWLKAMVAWDGKGRPPQRPSTMKSRAEWLAQINAGVRAAGNTVSFGVADNLEAASDALGQPGGISRFGERYAKNLQEEHALDAYNKRFRKAADTTGVVGGMGLGLAAGAVVGGPVNLTRGPRLIPGAATAISRPEILAGAGGGAVANVAAQVATDVAMHRKTTIGDAVGAGIGGAVGGTLAYVNPTLGAEANGFTTSIAQDIGNGRGVSLERAGQTAAIGGAASGLAAQGAAKFVKTRSVKTKGCLVRN